MRARDPRERSACRLLLALLPLLLGHPAAASAGVALWTQTGQTTGTIEALFHTSLLGGERILAGFSGGVRVSADSGATWGDLNDGLPPSTTVLEFAEFEGALYAATSRGVFRRDSGWTRYGPGPLDAVRVFALLYVPPATDGAPGTLLAGTDNSRVYRTVLDGGETWTEAGNGMPAGTDVSDLALSGTGILAGTPSGVFVSEDGGLNWTPRSSGLVGGVNALAVVSTEAAPAIFAGTADSMFVSRDGAASWSVVQVDPAVTPGLLEVQEILADPDYPGSVYAVVVNFTDRRCVYQSADGGISWRAIVGGISGVSATSVGKSVGKLGTNSRDLLLGTGAGVWRSTLPTLDLVTPAIGVAGTVVDLVGSGFGATQGTSSVLLTPGVTGVVYLWSDSLITFEAPPGVGSGRVAVVRGGGMSNGERFSLPELRLSDLDSGSSVFTNDVTVAARHVSVGSVDSLRVLSGFDVESWSEAPLDAWVAPADSSAITFVTSAEGDTVRAVIEFMVAGAAFGRGGGPVVLADTARIVMDLVPPVLTGATLVDLTSGSSQVTDSVDVWLLAGATGADSMRAAPGSALEFWPFGPLGGWSPYALLGDTLLVRLTGGEGSRPVFLEFADRAGNVTPGTATIQLDDVAPVPLQTVFRDLDSGSDELTDSLVVELETGALGAATVQVASGDVDSIAGMPIGVWVPYAAERLAWLTPVEGVHTIQVRFADSLGNETPLIPVAITLDTVPPPVPDSLYLADLSSGGRTATDSVVVRFRHEASGADSMRVRSGAGLTGWSGGALDAWRDAGLATSEITFAASATPVTRQVRLESKDLAGNSRADTVAILLDLEAPVPGALLARDLSSGTAGRTDSLSVRLVHPAAGADSMRLLAASQDSVWSAGAADDWVAHADSSVLLLAGGDGVKTVHLEFADVAGNTVRDSLKVTFDGTDPTLFFSFHQNPVLPEQLLLYVAANESLETEPLLLEGDVGRVLEALPGVEPPLWQARATLPAAATLEFSLTATDLAGNTAVEEFAVGSARLAAGEGARLVTPDGGAELRIPEGAVERELQVVMGRVRDSVGAAAAWSFLPEAATLSQPATVRLRAPSTPPGPGRPVVQRQGASGWVTLSGESGSLESDGAERWVSASTGQLGRFRAVWSEEVPAPSVPVAFRLLPNQPDPFRPLTEILFELPSPGPVRLEVYDVQGRRVATLLDGEPREAGRHAVAFRARGGAGEELPSGIYFARLRWGARLAVEKMVLLR